MNPSVAAPLSEPVAPEPVAQPAGQAERLTGRFDELLRNNFNLPVREFIDLMLYEVARVVGALQGVVYLENYHTGKYEAVVGYACLPANLTQQTYSRGEGLIGQVAKTQTPIRLQNLHGGFIVRTGLVELAASSLIIHPLAFNDQTLGVLELCFLQPYTEEVPGLVQDLCYRLATALQNVINRTRIQQILEETQAKNQELTSKEEELRQNLEELHSTQEQMQTIQQVVQRQKAEQEKFVALVQHSPNIILIIDEATHQVTYANDLADSTFDLGTFDNHTYTAQIGQLLALPTTGRTLEQLLDKIQAESLFWKGTLQLNTEVPGLLIRYEALIFPLEQSHTHKKLGLAFVLTDITAQEEEKDALQTLAAQHAELQREYQALKAAYENS
jgi:GAF domain-containing protein